jgi:hypothetical protein
MTPAIQFVQNGVIRNIIQELEVDPFPNVRRELGHFAEARALATPGRRPEK